MMKNAFRARLGRGLLGAGLFAALSAGAALADENGAVVKGPDYPCASDKIGSILEVCKAVQNVLPFVQCPQLNTKCYRASQEVFTGLSGESASPTNIKPWNGQGVSGPVYQSVGLCLLRDLNAAPMTSHAEASLPVGTIATDAVVDYMNFDPKTKTFNGSHRLTAQAPALGALDLMTQTFKVKAVDSALAGQGKTVGQYAVGGAHALEFDADAGAENFDFTLEGIVITTPYGTVSPKPYINVARGSFWSVSPFGGAAGLTMNPGGFQTTDVYGRLKGQSVASALQPAKFVLEPKNTIMRQKFCGVILKDESHCMVPNPVAWDSQLMLGSRNVDPRPTAAAWKAPAGQPYPLRPDADVTAARGDVEKAPSGLAKAGVRIEYDILGMLPDALLSQSFISVPQHIIFADPNVFVAFGSQVNFSNAQGSVWNPTLAPTDPSVPVVSPIDVESVHSMALFGGSTVAGRFAIDAGLDLQIKVHIDLCCWLDDIDFNIIELHPRAPFLETVDASTAPAARKALVMTSAQQAVKTGKPFQLYSTLVGGAVDGFKHLTACFADPPPPAKTPPPPTYTKGDPTDLIEVLDMQCNVCVGHADFTYVDVKTQSPLTFKSETKKGFSGKYPFVSDAGLPASEKWTCGGALPSLPTLATVPTADPSKVVTVEQANAFNKAAQLAATNSIKNIGCFDQCRVDQKTGKWQTIVKSAKTLYAEGKIAGAPNGCH